MGVEPDVAVVGANGFIGRRVTASLRHRGIPLAEYTRLVPFSRPDASPASGLVSARTVYWLVSSTNPQTAESHPERVTSDIDAFARLLAVLDGSNLSPQIVLVSSGGTVYDPAGRPPYAEQAPVRATSAYAHAKLRLEELLLTHPGLRDSSVVLRVSNAYGPGQPAVGGQGVVAHWLKALAEHRPIVIYGDPATTRDYVYVDDVVDAMIRVHQHRAPLPAILNVGSGKPTTLQDLATIVLDVAGVPAVSLRHEGARSFDVSQTWLDVSAIRGVLGWQPVTDLRTGVAAAWSSLQSAVGSPR